MGAFVFKDYHQIYSSIDDRSPEEKLAAFVLHTFVIDAKKIYNDYNRDAYADLRYRTIRGKNYKYSELSAPPLSEFLNDLYGQSCEFYCDVLDYDYYDFVKRIKLLLPEQLVR